MNVSFFVPNINPYLVAGSDYFVSKRGKHLQSDSPKMIKGSMPNDGGYYLFTQNEYEEFVKEEPLSKKYFRRFIGGREYLNNIKRYCLWLKDASPKELKKMPKVLDRVEIVKRIRLESKREATRKTASFPLLFGEDRHVEHDYLALPEVSTQRRNYLPVGYFSYEVIASNKVYMVPDANKYFFGFFSSSMFMTWIKHISGRLKSDYSISTGIVYNNFIFPNNKSAQQEEKVEKAAQLVLDLRKEFPDSSLADLYDPIAMPPKLVKAHQALDKAVDKCYRKAPFKNERERIEFLFELYEEYTAPLMKK